MPAESGRLRRRLAPSRPLLLGVALLTLGLLSAAALIGYAVGSKQSTVDNTPGTTSAEAGFARDMQVHHAQAVEMSLIVRDRSEDPLLQTLAYDIASSQQQQIGQMYAWLEGWGLSQTSEAAPMAWMGAASGHGDRTHNQLLPDGRMPGMASESDLQELRDSMGQPAEILWLRLMREHHRAGVEMANAALELVESPMVRRLATSIASSQQAEIDYMSELLETRGAA